MKEYQDFNLKVIIDSSINKKARLSHSEFMERTNNVKSIRTKEHKISYYINDIDKLKSLEYLHQIVNTGNFNGHNLSFYNRYVFSIAIPVKIYKWLQNVSTSTLHKQIINWHAAYCAFNSFQEFADEELDPLFHQEVIKVLKEFYSYDFKEKFNIEEIENDYEYELRKSELLKKYYSISEKYTGTLPPEFLKDPYTDPFINMSINNKDWGLDTSLRFVIFISYFTPEDWERIIENDINRLKKKFERELKFGKMTNKDIENIILANEEDNMERAESNNEIWQKWKHTYSNFEFRNEYVYSLIPEDKDSKGLIYLFQTESKDATKIGWTTRPSELRKAGIQTGNHQLIIERGYFAASSIKTESTLHKIFENKQIRGNGEWFNLSEEEILNILNKEWRMQNNIF